MRRYLLKILKMAVLVISLVGFCLIHTSKAHMLWIEREGEKFLILWGHRGKIETYDQERLAEIKVYDEKGNLLKFERKLTEKGVSVIPEKLPSALTASMKGVYLVNTPEGRKRMDKIEAQKKGLQVIESFYVVQATKGFFSKTLDFKKLLGLKLEPVLLDDPFVKRDLRIKVFYEGKPAEGVLVFDAFHKELGKTDSEGLVRLKKEEVKLKDRYYAVVFSYRVKTTGDPKADYLWMIISLTWQE